MKKKLTILLTAFSLCLLSQTMTLSKNYVMSFHSCLSASCGLGPSVHSVQLAESNDGLTWSAIPGYVSYPGSVPDVIMRSNYLYIYTPGKVRRYNATTSTWDAIPVNVSIVDQSSVNVSYVDPSAYVDQNGLINLFFLNSGGITGDPAICSPTPCVRTFDSAIEVAGSNGTQFIKQPGSRLTLTVSGTNAPTDPDIFYDGTNYFLYVTEGLLTKCFKSTTLHGGYAALATLPLGNVLTPSIGIPCGMYVSSSAKYFSYGHAAISGGIEIKGATHASFASQPTYTTLITGASFGLGSQYSVASPGICNNTFLTLGLKNNVIEKNNVTIFPNPSNEKFEIHSDKLIKDILISNALGQIVYSENILSTKKTVIANLEKGVYFLKVIFETGSETKRIVIE